MAVVSSPKEQNGSAVDGAHKEFENVQIMLKDAQVQSGRLTITENDLIWTPLTEAHQSWTKKFVDISLHAIQSDADSGYPPCIYAQFGEDCEEVRLVPADESRLRELYDALCEAAANNADEESEGETSLPAIFGGSGDGDEARLGGAADMLARLDGMIQVPENIEGWADDAEEEEETEGGSGNT